MHAEEGKLGSGGEKGRKKVWFIYIATEFYTILYL
jgi:hypothetical protein